MKSYNTTRYLKLEIFANVLFYINIYMIYYKFLQIGLNMLSILVNKKIFFIYRYALF